MKRLLLVLAFTAVPAAAQTELRGAIGLSDAASVTGGPRVALFRVGIEWQGFKGFRAGVALTKEGFYPMDGFGVEATLGRRFMMPAGMVGNVRLGSWLTMESAPYGSLSFEPGRSWLWRNVMLNGPLDGTALIPFTGLGFQRHLIGHFSCEAELRLSLMHTERDWAMGRTGAMRAVSDRSLTPIPGYSIGAVFRF
jgi:hypothetical protein